MTIETLLDQGKDGEVYRIEGFVKKDLGRYGERRCVILADIADETKELQVNFAPEFAEDFTGADMGQVITVEGTYRIDNSGERRKFKLSDSFKVTGKALKEPIGSRVTDRDIAAIIGMLYNNAFEFYAIPDCEYTVEDCHERAIDFITPARIKDLLDKRQEYKESLK